ncbi:MAG: hypothetical protein FJ213_13270 [Ignavibacteria bacterium]|nr:hypothetical protein [Ignavibacteria bacterium]
MFTTGEAEHLIQLPKKILIDEQLHDSININQKYPFRAKYLLANEEEKEFIFLLDVKQSAKFSLKFDLHHQEDQTNIGLLRVNYFGQHRNPEVVTEKVPIVLHKYAGKWFDFNEHHIHFYVEGYRELDWALPLLDDPFPVKEIKNNTDISDAFLHFCSRINLVTRINFEGVLV